MVEVVKASGDSHKSDLQRKHQCHKRLQKAHTMKPNDKPKQTSKKFTIPTIKLQLCLIIQALLIKEIRYKMSDKLSTLTDLYMFSDRHQERNHLHRSRQLHHLTEYSNRSSRHFQYHIRWHSRPYLYPVRNQTHKSSKTFCEIRVCRSVYSFRWTPRKRRPL